MANAAKRAQAAAVDRGVAVARLLEVAEGLGCRVERLRMRDYDEVVRTHARGPSLAEVLATFDAWKAARALRRGAQAATR